LIITNQTYCHCDKVK